MGRRFGMVRKLPSGRFQASFMPPDGARQNAPHTFKTKTDANRWLTLVEADISRGTWLDDRAAADRSATTRGQFCATAQRLAFGGGRRANGICGCTWCRWSTCRFVT